MLTVTVQHDPARQRFYAVLPDQSEAELCYRHPALNGARVRPSGQQEGAVLDFYHTGVPEAFRTEGVAEQIVLAGFRYAEQQGYHVIPSCPYVSRGFLKRHPEFQPLVAPRP